MGTSLALIASVAVAGTISYLTDTDSDVNVMTLGNVDIEQLEYERIVDETSGTGWKAADTKYAATFGNDTYYPDAMQPFTQGKLVMPLVYTDGDIKWDDRNGSQAATGDESHQQSWKEVGAPGSNQLFDNSVKNVIDKFVFVKNTGRSDAYYRTVIAIECPDGTESLIHTNTNGNSRFDWEDIGYTTIAGVRYKLKVATYNEVLTPGEVSRPSLLQVFLGKEATNEDVAKFGDTMDILVVSQGVQTSGFDNAAQALDEAFGDITLTNHPWSDEAPVIPTVVSNAEELKAEIENAQAGDTVSVVIANNITITEPIVAASGVKLVVDGGNHTITADGMTNEIVLLTGGNADISNLT
ncbi:MAG: hypothetical protein UIM53_02380, partial [Acutalibacteraceae bacterium]|nr:hypothetical protein [Acutalibacteraceae bacterium]